MMQFAVRTSVNAGLIADQLLQILYKADDDDDCRACQAEEKHGFQSMHHEINESVHGIILPRSEMRSSHLCRFSAGMDRNSKMLDSPSNALSRPQSHASRVALRDPSRSSISNCRPNAAMARHLCMDCAGAAAVWIAR